MQDLTRFRKEITPDTSKFGGAEILSEDIAIAVHILNLLLNKKGFSYPNYPDFYFDLTKFKFEQESNLNSLKDKISTACQNFFGRDIGITLDATTKREDGSRGVKLYIKLFIDFEISGRDTIYPMTDFKITKKSIDIIYLIHKNEAGDIDTKIYI